MEMIYAQFLPECEVSPERVVKLSDMAHLDPPDKELDALAFDVPEHGRRVDAVELAGRITQARPEAQVNVLGTGEIFVSRRNHRRGIGAVLLGAGLTLLLLGGAAFGITFFHADVNMLEAQKTLYGMFGGGELSALELAIPYSAGVFAGVGGFFLLGGRKKSPLALKLQTYRKQLEQAEESGAAKGKQQ